MKPTFFETFHFFCFKYFVFSLSYQWLPCSHSLLSEIISWLLKLSVFTAQPHKNCADMSYTLWFCLGLIFPLTNCKLVFRVRVWICPCTYHQCSPLTASCCLWIRTQKFWEEMVILCIQNLMTVLGNGGMCVKEGNKKKHGL